MSAKPSKKLKLDDEFRYRNFYCHIVTQFIDGELDEDLYYEFVKNSFVNTRDKNRIAIQNEYDVLYVLLVWGGALSVTNGKKPHKNWPHTYKLDKKLMGGIMGNYKRWYEQLYKYARKEGVEDEDVLGYYNGVFNDVIKPPEEKLVCTMSKYNRDVNKIAERIKENFTRLKTWFKKDDDGYKKALTYIAQKMFYKTFLNNIKKNINMFNNSIFKKNSKNVKSTELPSELQRQVNATVVDLSYECDPKERDEDESMGFEGKVEVSEEQDENVLSREDEEGILKEHEKIIEIEQNQQKRWWPSCSASNNEFFEHVGAHLYRTKEKIHVFAPLTVVNYIHAQTITDLANLYLRDEYLRDEKLKNTIMKKLEICLKGCGDVWKERLENKESIASFLSDYIEEKKEEGNKVTEIYARGGAVTLDDHIEKDTIVAFGLLSRSQEDIWYGELFIRTNPDIPEKAAEDIWASKMQKLKF